jgi:hypothetical protein
MRALKIKFERLKEHRAYCINLQMFYYQNKNAMMFDLMQLRIEAVVNKIIDVSIELKPFNDLERKEYEKTAVHQFLMASKGMNGSQILRLAIKNLTKPTL